ncbi:cation:proton antiporter [Candidatus Woesearchaeota archaeon]|nr:cation:proton antiporter [Candidatus Woesearchaeota archaeon]
MADPVMYGLTFIAVALLIGLLSSIAARKLKIPDVLLLVAVGIGFGVYLGIEKLELALPITLISGLGLFTLVLLVFESTAQIRFKELDWVSYSALKITFITVVFNFVILSFAALVIIFGFKLEYLFLSVLFGALMCGTAPDVILSLLGDAKHKILRLLSIESIINTPLTVLLPLIIVDLQAGPTFAVFTGFTGGLMLKLTAGLGSGLLIGLIVFKIMRKQYSETYSPIAVIAAALLSFVLAENIGGNGIIAVTTLGLFFGNLEIKQKVSLLQFESVLSTLLKVLIFVLIGVIIKFPTTPVFFIKSITLFIIYLAVRYLAIKVAAKREPVLTRLFMTLTASKGLAVVVVTFILASTISGFEPILHYILAFVLYSLIVSSFAVWFSGYFGIDIKHRKKHTKKEPMAV